jgi:hypothetical protein
LESPSAETVLHASAEKYGEGIIVYTEKELQAEFLNSTVML